MTTIVHTAINDAGESRLMQIEVKFARGFAGLQLIGNASEICRDGKERARLALESMDIDLPPQRLVVSLAPADVKKDGSQFDLPLAVALAIATLAKTTKFNPREWLFAAELGLDGALRPCKGSIPFVLTALQNRLKGVIVADASLAELSVLRHLQLPGFADLKILGFKDIRGVLAWLYDGTTSDDLATYADTHQDDGQPLVPNFDDMMLPPPLRLAALTVAVGRHNLLLRGSPGSGKSMFASRLHSILTPMNNTQHLEALRLRSVAGGPLPRSLLNGIPPFRNPHHQASAAAIMGSSDRPGELSLAHGGILFLDELPEYRRDILEGLREPLENGMVSVSRSKHKVLWKAEVLLIGACNNCPCGWMGSVRKKCRCATSQILAYRQRLSGPVLDRIDIHFNMPDKELRPADLFKFLASQATSQTAKMRADVAAATAFSQERNRAFDVVSNRDIPAVHLQKAFGLRESEFDLAVATLGAEHGTRRSIVRSLRVARTLADLDLSTVVRPQDIETAAQWQAHSAAKERGEHLLGL